VQFSLWSFSVQNYKPIPIFKWVYESISTCIYLCATVSQDSLTANNCQIAQTSSTKRKKKPEIQASLGRLGRSLRTLGELSHLS
jgi:hypothetical protein